MKDFKELSFLPDKCRRELGNFGKLLQSHQSLLEREHIRPFFQKSTQLAALLGIYALAPLADVVCYEFEIVGDFRADVVIGNRQSQRFCMIEFEEGGLRSIFTRRKTRSTKEWSRPFDHGFSQLVDWFHALDDLKGTEKFARSFGYGHVEFYGLLVIGRTGGLSVDDLERMRWRSDHVLINSHKVKCVTYDEMYRDIVNLSRPLFTAPND